MAKKDVIQDIEYLHTFGKKEYTSFEIRTDDDKKFGRLDVGKAGIKWFPRNSKKTGYFKSWEDLEKMLKNE